MIVRRVTGLQSTTSPPTLTSIQVFIFIYTGTPQPLRPPVCPRSAQSAVVRSALGTASNFGENAPAARAGSPRSNAYPKRRACPTRPPWSTGSHVGVAEPVTWQLCWRCRCHGSHGRQHRAADTRPASASRGTLRASTLDLGLILTRGSAHIFIYADPRTPRVARSLLLVMCVASRMLTGS